MRERLLPTLTTILIFGYYIITLLTKGLNYLQHDLLFGTIAAFSILILPALISKFILKRKYFGVGYVLSTLIYPIFYALSYLFHHQFNIDATLTYNVIALLILFSCLYLTALITYKEDLYNSKKVTKAIFGILIVLALILGTRQLLGLEKDSLLSLDFLQHNAVSMQISEGELCLTPNDCSSLFKKLGYTSYFHTIQTVLTVGFGVETALAETSFSLAFITISTLAIFTLFQKYLKDDEQAFLGALIAIFVFELGAYSFNFFLPQTLTLLLFVNILAEDNLSWIKIFLTTPILLAIHFIFGPFFTGILFIYQIFFNSRNRNNSLAKTITLLSFLAVIITFVANYRGFSVEKLIQQADIAQLGFYSNYYFPHNLEFIARQYGLLLIPLLISIIYFLFKKKTSSIVLFSILYISISLSCYFLAPTYANKFFLGSSVFISFLLTSLLADLKFKKFLRFLLLLAILVSTLPFYLLNFSQYNIFYTQNSGKISGIVREDRDIIEYLQKNTFDCQILSDPYSQIVVTGQTSYDTAGGQYQELLTRKVLMEFIESPNEKTYEDLLSSNDIQTPFCLLLSGRLYTSNKYVNQSNAPWLNSMYEYEINNNYNIGDFGDLIDFLKSKDYEISYSDEHFQLFTPTIE